MSYNTLQIILLLGVPVSFESSP